MVAENSLIEKVNEFVRDSYTKDGITSSTVDHQIETAEIVKELSSGFDEAMIIAALSHDIERAYRQKDMFEILKSSKEGFKSPDFLEKHQVRGAEIMEKFLQENGADEELLKRVGELIRVHEIGGTKDADLLKDADSLSFFRSRAKHFVETKVGISSKEKVEAKLRWMFERISSQKAKQMAEPFYLEAMKELG